MSNLQNEDIARIFDEIGDLLEIQGANQFRVRAYRNASRTLTGYPESLCDLAKTNPKSLEKIEGIGKDLAQKIQTISETGTLPQLEELREQVPPGVLQMLRIPGLGPKKAAALMSELGITSLDALKTACEAGTVAKLRGFGAKTQATILSGIEDARQAASRVLLAEAKPQADIIVNSLKSLASQVVAAGSLRRRKETVGDLDILAISSDSSAIMDLLGAHPLVDKVLARGETKQRVKLRSGLELDLRVVPEESFGAALQYFTGSKEHNIIIRRRAQERGLKINEYGVFRDDQYVAGRTEEEVYASVDLPWIDPEVRENRFEFSQAESGKMPRLLELAEIRGDLHMHTTESDGTASLRDMIRTAINRKLEYIAITDHSQRSQIANGLTPERLRKQWQEIDQIRPEFPEIQILKGVECDILEDGRLDLPDDVLAEADWVVASLHYGLKQPAEKIQERLTTAITSRYVNVIGHPSARIIGQRPPVACDWDRIFDLAAEYGTWMEINAHPSRLDLNEQHIATCREREIPLVISTDAHSISGFEVMVYGIYQGRRGGLTASDVANTLPYAEFQKRLKQTK